MLYGGSRYYMEAVMYEIEGADHVQVGMTLPGKTDIIPVTYKYLSIYE